MMLKLLLPARNVNQWPPLGGRPGSRRLAHSARTPSSGSTRVGQKRASAEA